MKFGIQVRGDSVILHKKGTHVENWLVLETGEIVNHFMGIRRHKANPNLTRSFADAEGPHNTLC